MDPPRNRPPRLIQVVLTVLAIVFTTEAAVMFLLPVVLPRGVPDWMEDLFDAGLLTTIVAPLLFFVLISPLRRIAIEERAKAASIIETAADGIITVGPDRLVRSFNAAAEDIFQASADQVIGQPLARLIADCPTETDQAMQEIGRGQSAAVATDYRYEATGMRSDGASIPLAVSVGATTISGEPLHTLIVRDLTETKRYQAELADRVAQQAVIVELGQKALACEEDLEPFLREVALRVSQTLRVGHVAILRRLHNHNCADLELWTGVGWAPEILGRALVPGSEIPQLAPALCGRPGPTSCAWPNDASHPGTSAVCFLNDYHFACGLLVVIPGAEHPFGAIGAFASQGTNSFRRMDLNFLQAAANVIASAIQRRRSEMQRRERDVLRAEQMAAVAQVAAGVAHEIRNPLTTVKLLIQGAQEQGAPGLSAEDRSVIIEEIRRMEGSLKMLLDFARPPPMHRRQLDVREIAQRTAALVRGRAAKQDVRIEMELADSPIIVDGDPEQIHQLLLNLALNALDEMPQGGRLGIEVQPGAAGGAEVRVRDTGPGIKPQVIERLFDAFVTGKETGVGLGLAVSRRIAEQHGGSLSGFNLPEGGACFLLRLPAPEAQTPSAGVDHASLVGH